MQVPTAETELFSQVETTKPIYLQKKYFAFMIRGLLFFLLLSASSNVFSAKQIDSVKIEKRLLWQKESSNKGCFYIYWGYNREYFTRSTIHFKSADYDLTFYDMKAHDRPSKFSASTYFNPERISIPQYCFRGGYFVTNRIHISFGIDHLKYVLDENQRAEVSGVIDPKVSTKYGGSYLHDTLTISSDLLRFEHTNGLNLVTLNVDYLQPCLNIFHHKIWLKWNMGLGGCFVITKTDVALFDDRTDNEFHLSGYSIAAHTGPRIEFWKWGFVGFEVRGGYMNLPDVPIQNKAPKRANHQFGFFEYYGLVGFQIPIPEVVRVVKGIMERKKLKHELR